MAYVLVASRIPGDQVEYLDSLIAWGLAKDRADAIRKIIEERKQSDTGKDESGYRPLPFVQEREYIAPPPVPGPGNRFNSQPKFKMYHSPSKNKPKDPNEMTANKLAEIYGEEYRAKYGKDPVAIRTEIKETSEGLLIKTTEDKSLEASEGTQFLEEIPIIKVEDATPITEESPRITRVELPPILGGSSEDPEGESSDVPEKTGPNGHGENGEAKPPPVPPVSPLLPPRDYFGLKKSEVDFTGWTEEQIRAYRRMFPDKE